MRCFSYHFILLHLVYRRLLSGLTDVLYVLITVTQICLLGKMCVQDVSKPPSLLETARGEACFGYRQSRTNFSNIYTTCWLFVHVCALHTHLFSGRLRGRGQYWSDYFHSPCERVSTVAKNTPKYHPPLSSSFHHVSGSCTAVLYFTYLICRMIPDNVEFKWAFALE